MTVIFSGHKWHSTQVEFSAAAGSVTNFFAAQTYFPGRFFYAFNDVSGSINLRGVQVTHSWSTFADGTTRSVFGSQLTVDSAQNLTGGTAQVLSGYPTANSGAGLTLIGISVAVTDLIAATATPGGRDDARLIAGMLAGNDLAGLSNKADAFDSHGGIDLIFANRGNDTVTLGDGMDCALGGFGDDSILGGTGDDLLIGNQDNDVLVAGKGLDMLDGGRGRDTLSGGAGADIFVFRPGDGRDRITDFDAALDVISIGVPGGSSADANLTDQGADALLTWQDNAILLIGRAGLTLDDLDLRFGLNIAEARLQTFVNVFDLKG